MPLPIILTDEIKKNKIDEFSQMLNSISPASRDFAHDHEELFYEEGRATIWLTSSAFSKTVALVKNCAGEVGWHGTASRISGTTNEFLIEDIMVYPQTATRSTVKTDQKAYQTWLFKHDEDTFKKMRMHSHSHADMDVTPSSTDDNHRMDIVNMLESGDFFIFMVWNIDLKTNSMIYDMAHNKLYETDDIDIKLYGEDISACLTEAEEMVKPAK